MLDFDLRRGTPNVLAQRIATRTVKFIQASIKAAFGKIVAAAITTAGASATAADGTALVVEHDFKTNTTALDDAQHL
ncbi:hypothetical protein [Herbiconiux daphne]|uniref:Uncharacterized protein n=1 Tax=Herbiconiux daphne TaxID=2970914 RepID=A0ABT2HA46_9MICO|nr:hypothetical protein [Herbiconiux daphne]MCS5736807.1 hypothetical protein [Herbiconiux daphne]